MSKVTLTWDEQEIDSSVVDAALRRGVRTHLLEDSEFRASIRRAITEAGESLAKDALYEAIKNSVTDALRDKIAAQRKELDNCLRDIHSFATAHASSYAARRYKELHDKLQELDKS